MELDSVNGICPVPDAHQFAFARIGGDLQAIGQWLGHDQRMVAPGQEWAGEPGEELISIMVDRGRLAMHQALGPHHLPPKGLSDALLAQANAKDRGVFSHMLDDIVGNTSL